MDWLNLISEIFLFIFSVSVNTTSLFISLHLFKRTKLAKIKKITLLKIIKISAYQQIIGRILGILLFLIALAISNIVSVTSMIVYVLSLTSTSLIYYFILKREYKFSTKTNLLLLILNIILNTAIIFTLNFAWTQIGSSTSDITLVMPK